MNKVFSYQAEDDTVIYFRDGAIRLITDLGSCEEVELGIVDAAGAELIEIESGAISEEGINFEVMTLEEEQAFGARINEWVLANDR